MRVSGIKVLAHVEILLDPECLHDECSIRETCRRATAPASQNQPHGVGFRPKFWGLGV